MAQTTIKTPYPGIFYRRPNPDAEPFVSEGDEVKVGDVVGLIEIMKNFYDVEAPSAGVVERFLVGNEESVEADQDVAVLR